jgi:nitroimidazol reductase NimA-like FMN-containing flavoprotein (pyridoxamine 5'-phosphate oxidase superfamily)
MVSNNVIDLLYTERVARMATIDETSKFPHTGPICFVFDGKNVYTTLSASSKRLKNIETGSKASFLVDRYVEESNEWKVLCGLLIHGNTSVFNLHQDRDSFMYGWKLLIQKYPQYRHWANPDLTPKDPEKRRILRFSPHKIIRWGFS